MKVLIMTLGTRGDVQPFVALGRALLAAGHETVLCGPNQFESFVATAGVPFAGVDDGPLRLLESSNAGAVIQGGLQARMQQMQAMPPMFTQLLTDCWQIATQGAGVGADVVVHNGQIIAGQHIGEALGVPTVLALPVPVYVPTAEFSWPGVPLPEWWPHRLNRASFAGMGLPALMFARVVDTWRRDVAGLPRRKGRHDPTRAADGSPAPVLHAISPTVLPRPSDWPPSATMTGYWFLPSDNDLPAEIENFLIGGPPPVFAGFGSMTGLDPEGSATAVVEAARRTGSRLVLAPGWGGLSADAATAAANRVGVDLCIAEGVDYRLLFPRMSVVVHHGGAGTAGAAFAAGKPQVICPYIADQPFWARIARRLEVAPGSLPQRQLTAKTLAERLLAAQTPAVARTASTIAARIACEDGLAVAVETIRHLARA